MTKKIKTIKDARKLIKASQKGPIIWFGKRGLDCIGFDDFVQISAVLCCDYGSDFRLFNGSKLITSLENYVGKREDWTTSLLMELLEREEVLDYLKFLNQELNFLCYQTREELEKLCEENSWKVLSSPKILKAEVGNRLNLQRLLREAALDEIPGEVVDINQVSFKALAQKWGKKFVLQIPKSSSGKGTYIIENENVFIKARMRTQELMRSQELESGEVKLTQFIKGPSPNINASVTKSGVLLSPFSFQIIGVPECTHNPMVYSGNDWSSVAVSYKIGKQIFEATQKFGGVLARRGYQGMFGLDFMVDAENEKVYVAEINARFQGSTQTLTMMQLKNKQVPLVAFHMLELLGADFKVDVDRYNKRAFRKQTGYQVILRSLEETEAKVSNEVLAGVYTLVQGRPSYVRAGYHLGHVEKLDEFVLTSGVPEKGKVIVPGARILKIQGKKAILDPKRGELNAYGSSLVENVYNSFALSKIKESAVLPVSVGDREIADY